MSEPLDIVSARKRVLACYLRINPKMLLVVLLEHMPHCFPSIHRIAHESGLSQRQVIREVAKLETMGIVAVARRIGRGSTYTFADGWMDLLPMTGSHQCQVVTSDQQSGVPVTDSHPTPDSESPPPVTGSHPKREVKREPKREGLRGKRASTKTPLAGSRSKPKTEAPETLEPTEATLRAAERHKRDWQSDWEDCRNWHLKNGVLAANWQAALCTWMKKAPGFEKEHARPGFRKTAEPQRGTADGVDVDESGFDETPPAGKVVALRGTR